MKQPETSQNITAEEVELIESLFKYPALEQVFDAADAQRLPSMQQKMQSTIADLERVVRRGSKDDAAKAAKVINAYQIALKFLDELETIRRA